MTKLWEEAGKSLVTRLFADTDMALVFWVWALTVWSIERDGWTWFATAVGPLFADTSATLLLAVAVTALLLVAISSLVVSRFTLPVLRALEGYWPAWPFWLASLRQQRTKAWQVTLEDLEEQAASTSSTSDPVAYSQIAAAEAHLRRLPAKADVMPTKIGNLLRAGERRPALWYGLDAIVVWPQRWLVLPEQPRADINQARTELDRTVAAFIWAVTSCALGAVWWPAFPIGVAVAAMIWRFWVPTAAEAYATLVSALFDTHRFQLYDALHFPRPSAPSDERLYGEAVTRILWNGGRPKDNPTNFTGPASGAP